MSGIPPVLLPTTGVPIDVTIPAVKGSAQRPPPAALVVTAWNLIGTAARRSSEDVYLSNWYIIGGTMWACIIALVGVLPWYQYGLGQVAVSGFNMHNAVGM